MHVKELFSTDEVRELLQRSDRKAAWQFFHTWFVVAATFTFIGFFPYWYVIIPAMLIIGGQQLAFAILMHDTAHNAVFESKKLNQFFGQWFGAYPILQDMERFRPYHIKHHVTTGSAEDPDLTLTKGYPTTVVSFIRKVLRDFVGASGIKGHYGVLMMHLGYWNYELGGDIKRTPIQGSAFKHFSAHAFKMLFGPMLVQGIIFSIFYFSGFWWMYMVWIGSLMTTYNFSLRVRSIAEHSCVPDRNNPMKNTRTVYAKWWEKILFAPHHVNFHTEHHLLMTAPSYNLPKMHKMIKERGYFKEGLLELNYWNVVKLAFNKSSH